MTLRQFEVFLAVAGERSFSRAAKKIHSSQPTLSEHVSELERELGKKLFFRRGREVTRVKERELDLGVVGGHTVGRGEECLAAGLLDELVLVVPSGHRWAKRRDIAPDQLAGEPMLMREPGSATRTVTERALQRAGVKFEAAMELDHTEAIKQGVMAGLGVSLVSIYAVQGEIATRRLCALRLRGVRIQRHFHVIHHEARRVTASARAFMELMEHTARVPRTNRRPT